MAKEFKDGLWKNVPDDPTQERVWDAEKCVWKNVPIEEPAITGAQITTSKKKKKKA